MSALKAKVEIRVSPRAKVPVTQKSLQQVTSVVLLKEPGNSSLLIECDPNAEEAEDFKVLDLFSGFEGIKDVGRGGIETIVKILSALTGQRFILVADDERQLHYRRQDYHAKVVAHELS